MTAPRPKFLLCINNGGYIDDLKVRTGYQVLLDESKSASHYLRIVDETGKAYLCPAAYFVPIEVPQEAQPILSRVVQFGTTAH